jgi:hypothetical protein
MTKFKLTVRSDLSEQESIQLNELLIRVALSYGSKIGKVYAVSSDCDKIDPFTPLELRDQYHSNLMTLKDLIS